MLVLLLALLLQDDVVKESDHELAPDAAVTVKSVVGRVRLRGTDKATAHVKTVKRGKDRDLVDIRVEAAKDRLTIEAKFPDRGRGVEVEIEIDVDVPRSVKTLAAEIVSGSIEVKDAHGDSKFSTVSGSLAVDGLQGDVTAVSISGDIHLGKVTGKRASVTLTSGSLEGAGEIQDLDITNVSGRIAFDLTPKGDAWTAKASSVSGSVSLRLPEKAGAKVELKTMSGDVGCDFDLRDVTSGGRHPGLRGTLGDGAGSVRATTVSGNVRLGKLK